tara:strand:- start:4770 stop:5495 length:726 start_codon:yes stop_codon:yes gene_type:complete
MLVRSYGPQTPSNGAAIRTIVLRPGSRFVKLVRGAQVGLLIHWNDPALKLPGRHYAERNGEVFVIGDEGKLWLEFPSSSLDTMEALELKVSPVPLVWTPDTSTAAAPVSLEFDNFHRERETIILNSSKSISNGALTSVLATQTALTAAQKWRSVVVSVGNNPNVTVDLDAILILYDADNGRSAGVLATFISNKRAGGFPVISFDPPPFNWQLYVGNESGANMSVLLNAWYSTSEPSGPVTR